MTERLQEELLFQEAEERKKKDGAFEMSLLLLGDRWTLCSLFSLRLTSFSPLVYLLVLFRDLFELHHLTKCNCLL